MLYLIVFAGAGIGGALRHAVNVAAFRLLGAGLPPATLFVNIVGSLAMAFSPATSPPVPASASTCGCS